MMKRGSWIAALLNLIAFILETLLSSSKKSNRFQGADAGQDDGTTDEDKTGLQAALDFLGIKESKDTAALRDAVKKKFRKLSLVHHPDRNENSEDSVETMQRVNHYYGVLCEEMDRREGVVHEDEEHEEAQGEKENHPEEEKQDSARKRKTNKRGKRRKSTKKPSRSGRHRQRHHEEQAAKEMEEEMREIRRQKQQMNAKKRKMKTNAHKTIRKHHLDTTKGREEANQEFVAAMNQIHRSSESASKETPTSGENVETSGSMHDIDEDEPPASPNEEPKISTGEAKEKPRNLIMECCMDDIAVALRMELADVAIATIQDRLGDRVIAKLKLSMLEKQRMPSDLDIESAHEEAISEVFQGPMDDDGNTILHYAVFYESVDVIGMVYFVACQADALPEIFLQENRFGFIPLDFCKCCVKDAAIPQKMQSYTDAARAMQPSLQKTAERLLNIVRHVDWISVLNAAASVGVGVGLFDTRFITALAITTAHARASENFSPRTRVVGLFSWHASWWVCRSLLSIPSRWILFFLVLPSVSIFVYCAGLEFAFLSTGVLPLVFLACMGAMSARIPVPARVKELRLGELQFYLLFTVVAVALQYFATWIFQDADEKGSYQSIDLNDDFHEFAANEAVNAEVKRSYQSIDMNDALQKFAAFEAEDDEF